MIAARRLTLDFPPGRVLELASNWASRCQLFEAPLIRLRYPFVSRKEEGASRVQANDPERAHARLTRGCRPKADGYSQLVSHKPDRFRSSERLHFADRRDPRRSCRASPISGFPTPLRLHLLSRSGSRLVREAPFDRSKRRSPGVCASGHRSKSAVVLQTIRNAGCAEVQ